MIPNPAVTLNSLAQTLMIDVMQATASDYDRLNLQLMAVVMMMIEQELDRAAARLVEENAAIEQLFTDAGEGIADEILRREIEAAATELEASLLVGRLRARNQRLRGLMIRLHEHVEPLSGPPAKQIEQRIWSELAASTRRRHLDLALA